MHPAVNECIFLGGDWLLYAGVPGDYAWSEMLAPCVVLAAPASLLRVEAPPWLAAEAAGWRHAGSAWSQARGTGIVLLYFDPLSREGLAIQRGRPPIAPWAPPARPAWDALLFEALRHGANEGAARRCVGAWREAVLRDEPSPDDVDARLHEAARLLADRAEGRLDLHALGRAVHLSPDHLRKLFKQATGMTLSRYQMWQRLRAMVRHACVVQREGAAAHGESLVHAAGFYDTPHGNRALQRYFGLSVGAAAHPRFVDCTTQGSGQ